MNIEVSLGEAIDKYSILELKLKKIQNESKLAEIQKEMNALSTCVSYKLEYAFYYKLLMYVNETIWDITDIIKSITPDNPQFASLSNRIFEFNQKRFRIKNWFNSSSNLKEQKSYATSHCQIIINTEQTIYNKAAEINYLAVEYDIITFKSPHLSKIQDIFKQMSFIYEPVTIPPLIINLDECNIPSYITRSLFTMPLIYISSGMLGDFIQSLSVINEKFIETGRKGILYITTLVESFRNGIDATYADTYSIIMHQPYIEDYRIHNNEPYDINLASWRNSALLYHASWYSLYKESYNVEWGTHAWLDVQYDAKWNDMVLINTTDYRWPHNIDFKLLIETYPGKTIYVGDVNQYHYFIKYTSLHVPFYDCKLAELCTAIRSCKLFAGSLSAPLSIAHAFHKDRIIGLCNGIDDVMAANLTQIWSNIRYKV